MVTSTRAGIFSLTGAKDLRGVRIASALRIMVVSPYINVIRAEQQQHPLYTPCDLPRCQAATQSDRSHRCTAVLFFRQRATGRAGRGHGKQTKVLGVPNRFSLAPRGKVDRKLDHKSSKQEDKERERSSGDPPDRWCFVRESTQVLRANKTTGRVLFIYHRSCV